MYDVLMKMTNGQSAVIHGIATICVLFLCGYSVIMGKLLPFVVNTIIACWTLFIFILTFREWIVDTIKEVSRKESSDSQ